MKKLFFVCTIALLWAGTAWGEDIRDKAYEKIYDIDAPGSPVSVDEGIFKYETVIMKTDENEEQVEEKISKELTVYYFDGFDFGGYDRSDPNLSVMNRAEIDAIKNGYIYKEGEHIGEQKVTSYKSCKVCKKCEKGKICKTCDPEKGPDRKTCEPIEGVFSYSIIGHSQGGLRALGYLTQLKKINSNDVNDIDAVITVSGIVQGMQALEGGGGNLKWAIQNKVNIVAKGLAAAIGVFDFSGNPISFLLNWTITQGVFAVALDIVMACLLPKFFHDVWYDPELKYSPQIRDMKPGSDYTRNNVLEIKKEEKKVKTGTRLVFEWRYIIGKWTRIKWYYPHTEIVDVYKTEVHIKEIKPKFDPNVPVGFIAGLNNRTLTMAEKDGEPIYDALYDGFKAFEIVFGVVEGAHILKSVKPFGLLSGSPVYAVDADKARKFCRNIDSEIRDIVGIKGKGDGFIALENQYIPSKIVVGNEPKKIDINVVSDPDNLGYIGIDGDKSSHSNIMKNPDTYKEAAELIQKGRIFRGRGN